MATRLDEVEIVDQLSLAQMLETSSSILTVCAELAFNIDREVAHYPYHLIKSICYLEEEGGMTIEIYNRKRVYILPDREAFYKNANSKAKMCAVNIPCKKKGGNLESVLVVLCWPCNL